MSGHYDIAVIGAGPAGAHAAMAAAAQGMSCLLLDEASAAGGQVWRQTSAPSIRAHPKGLALNQALTDSSVECRFGRRVWHVEAGFAMHALGGAGAERYTADRLIVAAGTSERILPFEGWTEPGVIGLAAATILLKADATLPGRRTLVAGQGPLLAAVGAGIIALGGEVTAIVDAASRADWLASLPALAHRPEDLRQGAGWYLSLLRHRVPIRHQSAIRAVRRIDGELQVELGNGDRYVCDAVAVGNGLTPAVEIARLLGARLRHAEELGGWVPDIDEFGRSSIKGLSFCGDGAGVRGAASAVTAGQLCGIANASDAGALDADRFATIVTGWRRAAARTVRAGQAMARRMVLARDAVSSIASETILCRCEDVSRSDIDTAIVGGATEINQLKAWTRCGMGPCQGRMCGEIVGRLLAERTGQARRDVGPWTARAPLRPVPLDVLIGEYDYADIPIPAAAPL